MNLNIIMISAPFYPFLSKFVWFLQSILLLTALETNFKESLAHCGHQTGQKVDQSHPKYFILLWSLQKVLQIFVRFVF